jgi:RNA polymerase sigma-70 factor (ECF subfamily)
MEEVPPVSLVESRSSDESLYERFRDKGDEDALRTLFERHWPSVFRLAHAIVRDAQHAEDAAQETLVRIVQAARAGRRLDPFAGWLRSVTVNEARMSLRSRKRRERREEATVSHAGPERQAGDLDPSAPIREYTESLDELHRVPLVLHYGLGLTHREVGEALGCPTGTASSRIREGLEKVREALAGKGTPVALSAIEAALAGSSGPNVPPVPRIDRIIARGAKAAGVAAGKKLAFALVAFVLCAGGMGGLVFSRLSDPQEAAPRTALEPRRPVQTEAAGKDDVHHALEPEVANLSSTFVSRPVISMGDGTKTNATAGPNKVLFGTPQTPSVPNGASGADSTLAHVRGRVLDPQGRPVPGARVCVAASEPGFRGPTVRVRAARVAAPPGGPVTAGPRTFAAVDDEVHRTLQTSRTLRALKDVASTETGADGTFDLAYTPPDADKLFVSATVTRESDTYSVERPFHEGDVGDLTVRRLPAIIASVRSGGAPVVGANVQFVDAGGDQAGAITDASGSARHATAAPRVVVMVTANGYATQSANAALAQDDVPLAFDLVPAAQILGTVRGPAGPIAGASVLAYDPRLPPQLMGEPAPVASTTTDGQGHYTLDGFTAGKAYELAVTPADETILKGELDVTAPANAADFTLGRGGRIDATLSTPSGSNDPRFLEWPGVGVQMLQGGSWLPVLEADADRVVQGNVVSFKRLAPGTYRVFAHAFLFNEAASDPVTIGADGGTQSVSLALTTGRTVKGRIFDGSGAPIPRSRVARGSGGAMIGILAQEDGTFEIPGFPDGPTQVFVGAPGYADRTIQVGPGTTDLGAIVLEPAAQSPPGNGLPDTQGKGPQSR